MLIIQTNAWNKKLNFRYSFFKNKIQRLKTTFGAFLGFKIVKYFLLYSEILNYQKCTKESSHLQIYYFCQLL